MLLCAGHALAVEVVEAVITTAVVDREPVDEVEVFQSRMASFAVSPGSPAPPKRLLSTLSGFVVCN
jgi:hypothetical protein